MVQEDDRRAFVVRQAMQFGQAFVIFGVALHSPDRFYGRQGIEHNQARLSGMFYPLANIIDAALIETPPGICQRQSLRPLRADRR